MDNLKTLMDKKQYDLVLKLTETSDDANDIFYRISALLALGRGEEALKTIDTHQKTLESNLSLLIKMHIDILCLLGHFDEAYLKVKYYENLPYESQVVEEILRDLPEYVREEEKKSLRNKTLSDEDLIRELLNDDHLRVLGALDAIRERDVTRFLKPISALMLNYPKQSIRSFALLLLVQKKVNQQFRYKHLDEIVTVNPAELDPPFAGETFNELTRLMQNEFKDPVLTENAMQIFSSYLIYIYPANLDVDLRVLLLALKIVAASYLQQNFGNVEELCSSKGLEIDEVEALIAEINHAMNDF